jgi:hypothetical protein
VKLRTTVLAFPFLCGCYLFPGYTPDLEPITNVVPSLTGVSVVPVRAQNPEASGVWTQAIANNLLRVDGIDSVRFTTGAEPEVFAPARAPRPEPGTQGVFALEIRAFNPYYPPSAQVEVSFYRSPGSTPANRDAIFLERRGTAQVSPTRGSTTPWLRFQLSLRADDPKTMRLLKRYARSQGDADRGFDKLDRIVRISNRFIDFVVHETIRECFQRLETKENPDGVDDELVDGRSGS